MSTTLEFAMSNFMDDDGTTPYYFSSFDSDFSTGYLEDALFEFTHSSKRRRFLSLADDDNDALTKNISDPIKSNWNWNCTQNCSENYNYLSQITTNFDGFSGEALDGSASRSSENVRNLKEMKAAEEEEGLITASDTCGSSSSDRDSVQTKSISDTDTLFSPSGFGPSDGTRKKKKKKKKVMTRVVYPFAVVKPGGTEGDVTLKDINERILMPPVRPVRHPVGDFACRPLVSANGAVGLSGKAVTAITRIQTQGRGTVTIIRTQG